MSNLAACGFSSYRFNGSKVDRCFSYSKIDAALQRNRNDEHMRLMLKAHEVATPSAPSATTHAKILNGSLGLLNNCASPYNATDAETNQEMAEVIRRKKERKWGM